jgi:soluble lytic murein transglycosylase
MGCLLLMSLCLATTHATGQAKPQGKPQPMAPLDESFLALRASSFQNDAASAARLADALGQYEIPAYVDYYRLKPRLQTAPPSEIREFLAHYDGSAIADRLRNDWLLGLGQRADWETFDEQYPRFVVNDDTQVKCFALTSRALKGQSVAVAARELLLNPRDYGDACVGLVATLLQQKQFEQSDVWQQVWLAAEVNAPATARKIAAVLEVSDKAVTQALDSPTRLMAHGAGSGRHAHELYLLSLGRVARNGSSGPAQAAQALLSGGEKLSAEEKALGWAQIALPSARMLEPEAFTYWGKTQGAPLSHEAYQWRVRSSLRVGDWKRVRSEIAAMPMALRNDSAWVYWQARAVKHLDGSAAAQSLLQSIAGQPHFYGQLATEELGQKITIPASAPALTPSELAFVRSNAGFQRSMKFFALGLRFEATREWNWELRSMNERQHLAAAEFARENNILDRMVNTSDRTKTEVDFSQRYPAPNLDIMKLNTQTLGLDKAWVYGLIRQESRFIMNAKSAVGASGLMQLMPGTASYMAKKIGLTGFVPEQVNDVQTNILLGTNYLNLVLGNLDGSQTMATAAYNAGPGRPRAWRSTLSRAVEGAIFAETIPFSETRGYVKNVLSNATYYAALFDNKPQSLKARLGMVGPKAGDAIALDAP